MFAAEAVFAKLPPRYRDWIRQNREMFRFAVVGSATFLVDTVVMYSLKWTILDTKPVTARAIGVIVATVVGYVLNREWSFRTRGGRERHHEAALYFLISGVGVVISSAPMWVARYALFLEEPHVSWAVQEMSDFLSGLILGTLLAMVFRYWAFRKFVFPAPKAATPSKPEVHTIIRTVRAEKRLASAEERSVPLR
ncbi:GtrA family protein [Crossiella cryophila]|uniref:Putative flippase GtrA n=1 Tax=Crossiella cryophila TaxID=43355 RepID=A0A7W7C794_9PSEU|nr:GtrA family protein [Crossiella cryophila]MBB4675780.1 putative flippase GtrA [Crossiella cryophila]